MKIDLLILQSFYLTGTLSGSLSEWKSSFGDEMPCESQRQSGNLKDFLACATEIFEENNNYNNYSLSTTTIKLAPKQLENYAKFCSAPQLFVKSMDQDDSTSDEGQITSTQSLVLLPDYWEAFNSSNTLNSISDDIDDDDENFIISYKLQVAAAVFRGGLKLLDLESTNEWKAMIDYGLETDKDDNVLICNKMINDFNAVYAHGIVESYAQNLLQYRKGSEDLARAFLQGGFRFKEAGIWLYAGVPGIDNQFGDDFPFVNELSEGNFNYADQDCVHIHHDNERIRTLSELQSSTLDFKVVRQFTGLSNSYNGLPAGPVFFISFRMCPNSITTEEFFSPRSQDSEGFMYEEVADVDLKLNSAAAAAAGLTEGPLVLALEFAKNGGFEASETEILLPPGMKVVKRSEIYAVEEPRMIFNLDSAETSQGDGPVIISSMSELLNSSVRVRSVEEREEWGFDDVNLQRLDHFIGIELDIVGWDEEKFRRDWGNVLERISSRI